MTRTSCARSGCSRRRSAAVAAGAARRGRVGRHRQGGSDRRVRRGQDGHHGELRRRLVRGLQQGPDGRRLGGLPGPAHPDEDRVPRRAGCGRHLPGGDLARPDAGLDRHPRPSRHRGRQGSDRRPDHHHPGRPGGPDDHDPHARGRDEDDALRPGRREAGRRAAGAARSADAPRAGAGRPAPATPPPEATPAPAPGGTGGDGGAVAPG